MKPWEEYARRLAVTNSLPFFPPAIYFVCKGHESASHHSCWMKKRLCLCWSPQTRLQTGRQGPKPACSEGGGKPVAWFALHGGLRYDAFSVHRHAKQGAETEEIAAGSDAGASLRLRLRSLTKLRRSSILIPRRRYYRFSSILSALYMCRKIRCDMKFLKVFVFWVKSNHNIVKK